MLHIIGEHDVVPIASAVSVGSDIKSYATPGHYVIVSENHSWRHLHHIQSWGALGMIRKTLSGGEVRETVSLLPVKT